METANDIERVEDAAIDRMVLKYRSTPTNIWLFSDLPVKKRMALAYLAADSMKDAPFRGDEVRQFIAAVRMVKDQTEDLFTQVREKDKLRGEYLDSLEWDLKVVALSDCGAFPHFGGFPREWSHGTIPDTAKRVAEGLQNTKDYSLKIQKKLAAMTSLQSIYMTALHFLPPILVAGGTVRSRDPGCEETKYDIDDGNHRAVAAAMAGETHMVAFVGTKGDVYDQAVDRLRASRSVSDIGGVLDELTTSGAAGSYEVPLGARPPGRKRRKKPKTPKTIEYK